MNRHLIAATAGSLLAATALAGPDWEEGLCGSGDAGFNPLNAQVPKGQPPFSDLNSISGVLEGFGVAGSDHQDMYVIYIDNVSTFLAATLGPVDVELVVTCRRSARSTSS